MSRSSLAMGIKPPVLSSLNFKQPATALVRSKCSSRNCQRATNMPKVKMAVLRGKWRFARLNLREVTHGVARNLASKLIALFRQGWWWGDAFKFGRQEPRPSSGISPTGESMGCSDPAYNRQHPPKPRIPSTGRDCVKTWRVIGQNHHAGRWVLLALTHVAGS